MCCMHSECNSSVFYNGYTPSKVHEQQEHVKFITFAIECCFSSYKLSLDGLHVRFWEVICNILFQEHSPLSQIILMLPQNNEPLGPPSKGYTSTGETANITSKCYNVYHVCSSIPVTLEKDFIRSVAYILSSLLESLA